MTMFVNSSLVRCFTDSICSTLVKVSSWPCDWWHCLPGIDLDCGLNMAVGIWFWCNMFVAGDLKPSVLLFLFASRWVWLPFISFSISWDIENSILGWVLWQLIIMSQCFLMAGCWTPWIFLYLLKLCVYLLHLYFRLMLHGQLIFLPRFVFWLDLSVVWILAFDLRFADDVNIPF